MLDTENAIVGCADGLARRTDAAHYLVIGRPVTQSADPAATLQTIVRSLAGGKASS